MTGPPAPASRPQSSGGRAMLAELFPRRKARGRMPHGYSLSTTFSFRGSLSIAADGEYWRAHPSMERIKGWGIRHVFRDSIGGPPARTENGMQAVVVRGLPPFPQ